MDKFDLNFYKGKKVFVTGHTGFKGSWLCKILANAGAIVTGYSLNPPTSPSLFEIANTTTILRRKRLHIRRVTVSLMQRVCLMRRKCVR